MGMVVGVPVFAVLYAAIKGLINSKLIKKQMPLNTELYQKIDNIGEDGEFYNVEPEQKESSDTKKTPEIMKKISDITKSRKNKKKSQD